MSAVFPWGNGNEGGYDMTDEKLRELANEVLAHLGLNRCEWDYDQETGEYAPDGCEEGATYEVEGPHEERCGAYCAEHAKRTKEERCTPPHRFSVHPIHGAESIVVARRFALAYLEHTPAPFTVMVSGDPYTVWARGTDSLWMVRNAALSQHNARTSPVAGRPFQREKWEMWDEQGNRLDPDRTLSAYPEVFRSQKLAINLPVGSGG